MDFELIRATLLALIQGLTEFLPISSSAHLILPSALLGWQDQGLAFDVAVHLGSLIAVVSYFRGQIRALLLAWWKHLSTGTGSPDSRLAWMVIVATMPAVIAGLLVKDVVEGSLRNIAVIAGTTIVFGLLLWYADARSRHDRSLYQLDWPSCLVIGLAQMLALVPGTSRSGITMTAALLGGLDRESASRFSFLLSIPVIAGASVLLLVDLWGAPEVDWLTLCYGLVVTAVVAYACIHYFLKWITRLGFLPFVAYRLVLGAVLVVILATGT